MYYSKKKNSRYESFSVLWAAGKSILLEYKVSVHEGGEGGNTDEQARGMREGSVVSHAFHTTSISLCMERWQVTDIETWWWQTEYWRLTTLTFKIIYWRSYPSLCNEIKGGLESEVWLLLHHLVMIQPVWASAFSKQKGRIRLPPRQENALSFNMAVVFKPKIVRRYSKCVWPWIPCILPRECTFAASVETLPYSSQCGCSNKASFLFPILFSQRPSS